MSAEEFFIEQFNKCVWVEDDESPGNIYMLFDKHHERKLKMNSILGNKNEIEFIKTEDTVILFYQDYKNGYLDCNYVCVWSVLEDKFGLESQEIRDLIKGILNNETKLNVLTPDSYKTYIKEILNNETKLNVLTPYPDLKNTYE